MEPARFLARPEWVFHPLAGSRAAGSALCPTSTSHSTRLAFNAGSSLVTLALPRPHGSVPVQMIGGASDFQLSLPTGVPARVTAGGGASEVSLEGQEHTGVAGGSVFTTTGWAPGVTGFDIDASVPGSLP